MYQFDVNSGFLLKSDVIRAEMAKPADLVGQFNVGVRGEFRALLWNPNGTLARDSGWNSNTIVDNGLNNRYDSWYSWNTWCCIGSGTTPPTTTDTTIETFLTGGAKSGGTNPMPYVAYPRPTVGPNYERYSIKKYRFDPGVGTGNVNEFTVGNANNGTDIFCRHVLPATIPKAANQTLDIFYRFYYYPMITPVTGQVTIKGVLYDWESSMYSYANWNPTNDVWAHFDLNSTFNSNFRAYPTGVTKGTPTTDPTPTTGSAYNASKAFLTQSGATRTNRLTVQLDWMLVTGREIQLLTATDYQGGKLQIEILDNATGLNGFPKDETEEMTIDWKTTWARV